MAFEPSLPYCVQPETTEPSLKDDRRRKWREKRSMMEWRYQHAGRYTLKRLFQWNILEKIERSIGWGLKLTPLYRRGLRNATRLAVNHIRIDSPNLPPLFDPYRILHLTDPHFDGWQESAALIGAAINDLQVDLCVLTGDYRRRVFGPFDQIMEPLLQIVDSVHARDGILATLGNHDPHEMVEPLEAMGLTVLVNETATLRREGEGISVTGVDDPHNYYTDFAREALENGCPGYKVALVHSPELYDVAARNGYDFYLCGHTHGGQICLPGGMPLLTHLRRGRRYFRGLWKYEKMWGYTSQGCGVVGIPVRFNTRSEVTVITLRRTLQSS